MGHSNIFHHVSGVCTACRLCPCTRHKCLPSADVLEANESCAVIVRAINQFWSPELLHLEAEFLSIFLRENRTADVKGDGNLTALRRKDKNVVENYSETMEGAVC